MMFINKKILSALFISCFVWQCATNESPEPVNAVISQSHDTTPEWIYTVDPDSKGGILYFVGVSKGTAIEQEARKDALRNAREQVVQYMGTYMTNVFEEKASTFGLSSSTFNPTQASKSHLTEVSDNVTRKVKSDTYYIEQRKSPSGEQWFAYLRANVPETAVDNALKDFTKEKAKEAEKKAAESETEEAKKQHQDMKEFWDSFDD